MKGHDKSTRGRSLPRGFPFNGQLNFSGVAHFFIPASRGYTWSIILNSNNLGKPVWLCKLQVFPFVISHRCVADVFVFKLCRNHDLYFRLAHFCHLPQFRAHSLWRHFLLSLYGRWNPAPFQEFSNMVVSMVEQLKVKQSGAPGTVLLLKSIMNPPNRNLPAKPSFMYWTKGGDRIL